MQYARYIEKIRIYALYGAAIVLGFVLAFLSAKGEKSQIIGNDIGIGDTVYADSPAATGATGASAASAGSSEGCAGTGSTGGTGGTGGTGSGC